MKKLTLLAAAMLSTSVMAVELPQLKDSELSAIPAVVGSVKINGVKYNKVLPQSTLNSQPTIAKRFAKPGLYQGDMLQRNKLSNVERVSGNILVRVANPAELEAIAKSLNLDIHSVYGDIAILTTPKDLELMSTMSALANTTTGTVKWVDLERVSNNLRPE